MIDFTAYKRYSLNGVCAIGSLCPGNTVPCKCRLCFDENGNCPQWMRKFAEKAAGNDSAAEDSNYLLLPARVLGYCFNTKVWAQFQVNRVGAMETPDVDNMMQKLIFPEETESVKEDLKILIEQHGSTQLPLIVDPIKGKGAGLVVLLHGKRYLHDLIVNSLTHPHRSSRRGEDAHGRNSRQVCGQTPIRCRCK